MSDIQKRTFLIIILLMALEITVEPLIVKAVWAILAIFWIILLINEKEGKE